MTLVYWYKEMKISEIKDRQILDSRGVPTIEADVCVGPICGRAAVPSGKSTGKHEALEKRDGGSAYGGAGVLNEVQSITDTIAPALIGFDVTDQVGIDERIKALDRSAQKSNLGGNTTLAVSLAAARAAAQCQNLPLWQYLAHLAGTTPGAPRLLFNVINGGQHAGGNLAFQEYHVVPRLTQVQRAVRIGAEVYGVLHKILVAEFGPFAANVGDEGGFTPPCQSSLEPFDLIWRAVEELGYSDLVDLGMDAAASSFYDQGVYNLDNQQLAPEALGAIYKKLAVKYPLAEIEDPFSENDLTHFSALRQHFDTRTLIVGDDLTVTTGKYIDEAAKAGAIDAVIIKVNQIGTLTEALSAAATARSYDCKLIVSHRSGETEDTFISHLAWGLGAWGLKAGAPARGERTAKYNELIRISETANN